MLATNVTTPGIRELASTSVDMDSFAAASLRREYKLGVEIRKMLLWCRNRDPTTARRM